MTTTTTRTDTTTPTATITPDDDIIVRAISSNCNSNNGINIAEATTRAAEQLSLPRGQSGPSNEQPVFKFYADYI